MIRVRTSDQKKIYFLPYLSENIGINKTVAAQPPKYADPISPIIGLGKQIMSSYSTQLCKLVLEFQSIEYSN